MNHSFQTDGFEIVQADDLSALTLLREQIRDLSFKLLDKKPSEVDQDLNLLHECFESPQAANEFRLKLTTGVSEQIEIGQLIYEMFKSHLEPLVGFDVLVQKTPNLVFQPPEYPVPTELHRDAPANSPYEVVVWLPFVDCFRTKSMYVLNRQFTQKAIEHYSSHPDDKDGFDEILLDHAELMEVPFGSALIFWSGLFHGSIINKEKESRLSLNIRYKNLFSPLGLKDSLRYFSILKTSPLTNLGLDFQLREQLK